MSLNFLFLENVALIIGGVELARDITLFRHEIAFALGKRAAGSHRRPVLCQISIPEIWFLRRDKTGNSFVGFA